jgi:hypothetical protein
LQQDDVVAWFVAAAGLTAEPGTEEPLEPRCCFLVSNPDWKHYRRVANQPRARPPPLKTILDPAALRSRAVKGFPSAITR